MIPRDGYFMGGPGICDILWYVIVSHDSSVGKLMHLTIGPLHCPSSIASHGGEFKGSFPGCLHTLGEEMGAAKLSQAH